jgi:hypothetical protein
MITTVLEVLAVVWAVMTALLTVFLLVSVGTNKLDRRRIRRDKDRALQTVRAELEAMPGLDDSAALTTGIEIHRIR